MSSLTVRIPVPCTLEQAERAVIEATVRAYHGNKPKAAKALGISLTFLYSRLPSTDAQRAAS